jgi:hypothetical protein
MLGLLCNAYSNASRLSYSIKSKLSPLKGPNLLYLSGSSEEAQAAIVLPQKLPLANKIVA